MASPDPPRSRAPITTGARKTALRDLFTKNMLWVGWLPVILIGVAHYATGAHHHWAHDVLRRAYYVPILFAAFSLGVRGGLAMAITASLTYAPHAFFLAHAQDPATTANKLLEILLYNTIGLLAGVLADREAGRRRQAERAFAEQQAMAEQLVRAGRLAALGELVAGIAHEIKNPLHTLKGTAEIVDEVIPKGTEQAKMWSLLRREIDRLEKIAERFLSFARPSEPALAPHSFADVYARIGELLTAQLHQASGVLLHRTPLPNDVADARLKVDPDQLAQLALNIAGNALRAMGDSGELRISGARRSGDGQRYVTLRLENDGPTIPTADMERIFDPFFTESNDGTGLGLAIAERIAEAHGGFIEVRNTGDERGVAFTVVLPTD